MEINYFGIGEHAIDTIFTTALAVDEKFATFILSYTNENIGTIDNILVHGGNDKGETDIAILYNFEGYTFAALIENKLSAKQQPDQCKRYFIRGNSAVKLKEYDGFRVGMLCPKQYYEKYMTVQSEPDYQYQFFITYEDCIDYFENNDSPIKDVALSMFRQALERSSSKSLTPVNEKARSFSNAYIDSFTESYPEVEFATSRESNGYWIKFKAPFGILHHKISQNCIDWEFRTKSPSSRLHIENLTTRLPFFTKVVDMDKSTTIRYKLKNPFDTDIPFSEQKSAIEETHEVIFNFYMLSQELADICELQEAIK